MSEGREVGGAGSVGTTPAAGDPDGVVWLDGRLVPAAEARISPFDHGLVVGDGVFETCKIVDGVAFALTRHLRRLTRSAKGLHLPVPSAGDLRAAVEVTIAANPGAGRVRVTVTGGPGPIGSARGEFGPTVLVTSGPPPDWPASTAVVTVRWPRNERSAVAGLKTISYAENVVTLAAAHDAGATEALVPNLAGNLCEGTGSNVFVVLDGRLVTPPLSSGCLAGITRELLLEVTDAVEADVPMARLAEVEEAFLTSSTREVQPISAIDGRALACCPGPAGTAAAAAFARLVARSLDP